MRRLHLALLLASGLALSVACSTSGASGSDVPVRGTRALSSGQAPFARGARLYDDHCAVCHGHDGAGDGPASPFLFPGARDFTKARFHLVSTENGAPSNDDLVRTLRRGLPGSAMPAWDWMETADLEALAGFVRQLASEGLAKRLLYEGLGEKRALADAARRVTPGAELPRVAAVEPTTEVLAHGRALYLSNCAACHGEDGAGRDEPRFDEDGSLNWPRDFTAGYLKGGRDAAALGWRIAAGLPGTVMPATDLATEEAEALVAYLQSQIAPEAESKLVHHRGRIVARRVESLPTSPGHAAWDEADETLVVVAPLFAPSLDQRITEAHVAAFHDGNEIAIRVRWSDSSSNLRIFSDVWEPDGCALQFSEDEQPKLFGMGSLAHRTNIWHWKALRMLDLAGALDLVDPVPHAVARAFRGEVRTDVPLYRPIQSLPAASETVDSLEATGVGQVDGAADVGGVHAWPRWADGEWRVVFRRSCVPTAEDEVRLFPGKPMSVSVAIWNGAVADRGARKSISIWQALELEPEVTPQPASVLTPRRLP